MDVLRVKNWDAHYETARTRKAQAMHWFPLSNKHDGDGYTELVDVEEHANGPAHYGCWCVILAVASKCHPRGWLLRDTGLPHTPASLARKTKFPKELLAAAIPRLLQIGWLEQREYPDADIPLLGCKCGHKKCPRPAAECTCTVESCTTTFCWCKLTGDSRKFTHDPRKDTPTLHNSTVHNKKKNALSKEEIKPTSSWRDDEHFVAFWEPTRKKVGVEKAWQKWKVALGKIRKARGLETLTAKIWLHERWEAYNRSDTAKGKYGWDPATWLNQGHYDDDPKQWEDKREQRSVTGQRYTGEIVEAEVVDCSGDA